MSASSSFAKRDHESDWSYEPDGMKHLYEPVIPQDIIIINKWFVDFQYYRIDTSAIFPKEISILSLYNNGLMSFIVKSPVNYTFPPKCNTTINYQYGLHKTPWNHGNVTDWLSKMESWIRPNDIVYVKGTVKMSFLQQHGFNAVDVDPLGCPSLKELYGLARKHNYYKVTGSESSGISKCDYHKSNGGLCAIMNTYILRRWWRGNIDNYDTTN